MIKISENKLNTVGIEFSLPENFYIDIEGMEGIHQDGLRLLSPEKDCRISFMTTEIEYESAVASLIDVFTDDAIGENIELDKFNDKETGYKWIEKPQMTVLNNLSCAHVKYETPHNYYYEVHFERIAGFDRQLEVLLTVSKENPVDLETVLSRENVNDFYNSFGLYFNA